MPATDPEVTRTSSSYEEWGLGYASERQREVAAEEVTAIVSRHVAADGSITQPGVPALTRDLANLIVQIAEKAWSRGHDSGFEEGALGEDL